MADEFDFISATDRPALLALCTPEWQQAARKALKDLGYKVHTAATHSDFLTRFGQIQYEVVIVEELFAASTLEENSILKSLQNMSMGLRRHATVILLANSFQTFNTLQAFQQSVHAIVNGSELLLLGQLIEKAVADNTRFLLGFREAQSRGARSKSDS
jgi:hypothetical protein